MSQCHLSKKHAKKNASQHRFLVEGLESRQLFSAVAFGTPVSTPLPNGFVPDKCFPAYFLGGDTYLNSFVLTSKSGDALLLQGQDDGTFTVLQDLHPTGTVLGVGQGLLGNDAVGAIVTTTGLMTKQSNGQFALSAPIAYPSDAIPGNYMLDAGLDHDGGTQGDFIVERFKPNAGDPTHGDLILAVFRQHETPPFNLQYDAEIDTTIATNVTKPAANEPIVSPNYSGVIPVDNIVVGNSTYTNSGVATFTAGTSLGMTDAELAAPRYRADLVSQLEGLSSTNVALFPAPAAPGASDSDSDAVQFFTPNSDGGLSRGARADVAPKGTTAGPAIFSDFTKDGPTDIATAVVSGPDAPAVAIVPGGSSGYLDPVYVPLPGVTAVVAQHFEVPDLICLTDTPKPDGTPVYSIVTLPNAATDGPVLQLTTSSAKVYAGQAVTLTARISTQQFFDATPGVAPVLRLYDGVTAGQTVALDSNGYATFTVSNLSPGTHTFTVQPPVTAIAATSPPVTVTVSAAPAGGLISASGFRLKTNGTLVPGDSDAFTVHLSNLGSSAVNTTAAITVFASPTATITKDSIQIYANAHTPVHLAAKQGRDVGGTFTVPPSIVPGSYYLIADVASSGGSGSVVLGQTLINSSPTQVQWEFGHVGSRQNVKFVQHLSGKDVVTYTLSGAGTGVVSLHDSSLTLANGDAGYSVSVSSTNSRSKLTISQKGSTQSNLIDLTLNADIGSVDVQTDSPSAISTGPVDSSGNPTGGALVKVKDLTVGSPTYAVTPSQIADGPAININGSLGKLTAGALSPGMTITIAPQSTSPVQMNIASMVEGVRINSSVPISSFTIGAATDSQSTITAPSIGKLKSTGDFLAALNLTGSIGGGLTLGSADIASVDRSRFSFGNPLWTIYGNVGDVRIRGSAMNLTMLAGALAGAMGSLSAPDALFKAATVHSLTVNGGTETCVFAAGLNPVDGTVANGNDTLLAGGSFGSINIGLLDFQTKIVASNLPKTATISKRKVSTAGDARFSLNRDF